MSAVHKSIIVGSFGLLLALVLGSQLGQGSWVVPVSLAGGCALFGVYVLFFRAIRLEALILGGLVFGYIVGNRGFAQVTITAQNPIYVGEAGMLACLGTLGIRFALQREKPLFKSPLFWA